MTAISTRSPVVCATDFSDNAKKAGTVAAALARRMGAPLVLVHAVNLGPSLLVPVAERRTALRVEQVQLQEEVRRLQTGEVAITTVLLEEGWAAEALLGYVGKIAPRCVVLSARRMSALDRWATGSVSDQIAQHAMCPTIVVRDASPFVRWVDGKAPLKIFVALDFGCCTNAVLRWVDEIRQVGPCELTVCHVNWRPEEREFVAAKGAGLNAENTPAEQQSLERDLRKKLRDALGTDEAKIVVKPTWGAPESELIDAADAGGADLMVVGTHQRHGLAWLWHGSVSRALVHHATMNVACVPTSATIDPKRVHVPQFRRVLVATDLSTAGNGAIPLACAAVPPGGVVEVLHVVSPIEATRAARTAREQLKHALEELAPAEAARLGIRIEANVLAHRSPANAIVAEAERFGADLICIAAQGSSGWPRAFLGSVAKAVMEGSRRPVLVAHPPGS